MSTTSSHESLDSSLRIAYLLCTNSWSRSVTQYCHPILYRGSPYGHQNILSKFIGDYYPRKLPSVLGIDVVYGDKPGQLPTKIWMLHPSTPKEYSPIALNLRIRILLWTHLIRLLIIDLFLIHDPECCIIYSSTTHRHIECSPMTYTNQIISYESKKMHYLNLIL